MSIASTDANRVARIKRHALRVERQAEKRPWGVDGMAPTRDDIAVPRGTARNLRRKHLQMAYAKRVAAGEL